MSDSELKVTDKRMFTPEGELREEYRPREEGAVPKGGPKGEPAPGEASARDAPEPGAEDAGMPPATLLDLVGLLVRTVAHHLGGEQRSSELARFHIDLLEVLRRKTDGNLEPSERAALDDALYRLRMLYVESMRR